jgi:hypothetical protein
MSLDHGGYYYARHGARGTAVAEVPFLGPYARTGGGAVGISRSDRQDMKVSNECGRHLALVQIEWKDEDCILT